MKNILFVSSCYPSKELPQYCIFLEQQAKALIKLKNKVDVLIPTTDIKREKKCIEVTDKPNIYYINYKKTKISGMLNYIDKLFIKQAERLIVKNKYDCISVHLCDDAILKVLCKIGRRYNIKIVAHYHGLNVWKDYYCKHPYYAKYKSLHREKILQNVDAIVGVSDKVSKIIKEKLPIDKVFTVYNGVDTELFKPSEQRKDNVFEIICVANLIPIKGQRYLIEAVDKLIRVNNNVKIHLNLVGRGSEELVLKQQVLQLGISENVTFYGYVEYEYVSKLISESDVFVMPSYYEALGCVYLEAMSCKVPIIACEGAGIDEIIKHNIDGLLVKQHSSEDIFCKLNYLLSHKNKRLKMAEEGYKTVQSKFRWEDSAKQLDAIYKLILKEK